MRRIQVRFKRVPELEHIEVLVEASERDAEVETFLTRISGKPPDPLTVTDADGAQLRLAPEQIILVSMNGNNARIETKDGAYSTRQTLQSIEQTLTGRDFLRISRSELINMSKIIKYDFTVKRELRLELTGGIETWASRRYIPEIRKKLNGRE